MVSAPVPPGPSVAVLGASGLIGHAVAATLLQDGFAVTALARRFSRAQRQSLGGAAVECAFADPTAAPLAALLAKGRADVVVNCVGVLQDTRRTTTEEAHLRFVERLLEALRSLGRPALLVHVSIPGLPEDDRTAFSRSKRLAEQAIAAGGVPHVILRPGFVVAPAAYGGSALVRALAALPLRLPAADARLPFVATDVRDLCRTVTVVTRRWHDGERAWAECWDVMERRPATVGQVVEAFRRRFGGPDARVAVPSWLMVAGATAADLMAHLGWRAPLPSTALREMRRGVQGDPTPWIAATGIEPASLDEALRAVPASVQERWFARLYLAKPLVIGTLAVFWIVSGLVPLAAFDAARAIFVTHGVAPWLATALTAAGAAVDIAVGAAIAARTTCRGGLLAGIGVALAYMAGATLVAPDLWLDPLGAVVKIAPAIALMLVALAILDDR